MYIRLFRFLEIRVSKARMRAVDAGRDRVKSRACRVNASERMHFPEIR
jgi:hypothetical protein